MLFLISDTFTDSFAKLTGDEQKAVKTTVFDMQMNPNNPGMKFHKVDGARDKNFWSLRVSQDIRLIVHKTATSLLLCYVDHHDKAYKWAERRRLESHPRTGAAQLVEIRECIEEIPIRKYVETEDSSLAEKWPLSDLADDELLKYGIPREWLEDIRQADEDSILELADHLPAEAAEAVIDLAIGVTPQIPYAHARPGDLVATRREELDLQVAEAQNPFSHPDAQRRFRSVTDMEELERALEAPWEKWSIFLHPAQREIVERDYSGPTRVAGSAGTGKTVVALHRAVHLARSHKDARVLLTTFSDALANTLKPKLRRLIGKQPRLGESLEVHALDAVAERLYTMHFGQPNIASRKTIRDLLAKATEETGNERFSQRFLLGEWEDVMDAWQLHSWEAYRDVLRLGRKTRLPESRREALWAIFKSVRGSLASMGLVTRAYIYTRLAEHFSSEEKRPYEFIVVDEAQDVSVPQLRFLSALAGEQPNGLFFAGDLGQRIFQSPFSWKSLGVDIRGRSRTLYINYRTSHQIRSQADRLLAPEIADVDGNVEDRRGTISAFNGPKPAIDVFDTPEAEINAVAAWLKGRSAEGVLPREMAVFVRSESELERAQSALLEASLPFKVLDERMEPGLEEVAVSTMHLAKGLEFRAVAVMACDDEVIPLQERIESVADDADLEEIYNTERHLLYVACTRARDHLRVTGVDPVSEFLEDLAKKGS